MKPPIFVIGPPRCGTTLTARILGRHSRIFMPGETHYFHDVYSRKAQLGEPPEKCALDNILDRLSTLYERYNEPEDQRRIGAILSDKNAEKEYYSKCMSYKDVLDWLMETQMKVEGKHRWGNQAPKDIFHIKEIGTFYPDAKVIVCVRDVRDFLLSYKYKWKATTEEHTQRIKALYHPVLTSLVWRESVRRIRNIKNNMDYMIVRYEDIVTQPEYTVKKICQFVEEEYEPAMLEVSGNNSSKNVNEDGIFSSSVGKWKSELSNEDAYIGQTLCSNELNDLAYEKTSLSVNLVGVGWKYMTLPTGLWRALKANSGQRGPLLPYLFRRIGGLVNVNK